MRAAVLILGLLAWVLSCFDAVSYVRARENESMAQTAQAKANDALTARETAATNDNDLTQQKIEKDLLAVQTDELVIENARKLQKHPVLEQQALATDHAKLEADRIVEYNFQEEARSNPDPQVTAARENVDIYQKTAAGWHATRMRDVTLAHALIALWAIVIAFGLLAARRRTEIEPLVFQRPHH